MFENAGNTCYIDSLLFALFISYSSFSKLKESEVQPNEREERPPPFWDWVFLSPEDDRSYLPKGTLRRRSSTLHINAVRETLGSIVLHMVNLMNAFIVQEVGLV